MDAATLYIMLTLANGSQSTSTKEFPTLQACEVQAASRQRQDRTDLDPSKVTIEYRCVEHPGEFVLAVCEGPNTPCAELGPWSHQRCDAHRWMVRLRDGAKKRIIYCWERAPPPLHARPSRYDRWKDYKRQLWQRDLTRGGGTLTGNVRARFAARGGSGR